MKNDTRINSQDSLSQSVEKTGVSQGGAAKAQQIDPDLAKIVAAWPTLAEPIKRAMLALIG